MNTLNSAKVCSEPSAPLHWPQTYFIQTYGCQMNVYDSEIIGALLEERGCRLASEEGEADIVIFNTCCIRDNADQKVYGRMGDFKAVKERNPNFMLVIAGCLAQKDKQALLERFPHIDLVLGTHQVKRLPEYIDNVFANRLALADLKAQAGQSAQKQRAFRQAKRELSTGLVKVEKKGNHLALQACPSSKFMAMTPISVGCNQWCTYCIVPHVRGPLQSRPLNDVITEVTRLAQAGFKDITLLGQNVNDYGRDLRIEEGFAQLLKALGPEQIGNLRLRFTSPHPAYFTQAAIEAMAANSNVCPHIHLPLQSGDDRILEVMHRRYTGQEFLDLVDRMRRAMPGLCLTTDIIVGFADETEAEFQHTLDIVRQARFDSAFMFAYSERPGTPGSQFANRVPENIRLDRLHKLIEVQNSISEELNMSRLGQEVELLIEGPSKKNVNRYTGRSPQHWLVHVDSPQDITGQFVKVRLDKSYMWGFTGSLVN
ncbi:MAG: tRNA (N6-isopentenyl adenosine(37)-C2)-methylthiotransferase MiaB [Candidatus Bruticola sp.]